MQLAATALSEDEPEDEPRTAESSEEFLGYLISSDED